MEMLQGMELTRTNRSGGLTTYFSIQGVYPSAKELAASSQMLEARREKVKAITLDRVPKTT